MPLTYDDRLEVDIKRHTDPVETWYTIYADLYDELNTYVQLKDPEDIAYIVDAIRQVYRLQDKLDDALERLESEVR